MVDWDTLHETAHAVMPPPGILPQKYMVAVLKYPDKSQNELEEDSFCWLKGHYKIAVATVQRNCAKYFSADFELQCNGEVPSPETTLKDLNHFYRDRLIVFRAESKSASGEEPSFLTSTPLKAVPRSAAEAADLQKEASPTLVPNSGLMVDTESVSSAVPPLIPVTASPIKVDTRVVPQPLQDDLFPEMLPLNELSQYPHALAHANGSSDHVYTQPSRSYDPMSAQSVARASPMTFKKEIKPSPSIKAERRSTTTPWLPEPHTVVFDPSTVFAPEPALDDETKPTDRSIRKILEQRSPEMLEACVTKSMQVLEALITTFANYRTISKDAAAWTHAIEKLEDQAERARTVIGVVGSTGSGKSSIINAMLDEERLVPTNCMRACTAVVTEISYNEDNDPSHKFRAEIEFIGRSDWEAELKIILKECISENGTLLREASDQNSDAGVAWAKFRAVYPSIRDLRHLTVEKLMEQSVLSILDTTKSIKGSRSDMFYSALQKYVDSKEKVTGHTGRKEQRPASSPEFWPLIKVVKIYTKASALSTGAIIVDLPGVHDSNAARAAVADGYMKQCTGVWIVAPITRAVDDQAAKKLLGDSFKMQMKYDGAFSTITFICSKTDDISIEEATRDLQLHVISNLEDQQRVLEDDIEKIDDRISESKESIFVYGKVFRETEKDLEEWRDLKDAAEDGEQVFEPKSRSGKRKRGNKKNNLRKRRRAEEEDSDIEFISSGSEANSGSDTETDDDTSIAKAPLTLESIKKKIEDLKSSKKNARNEKATAKSQIHKLKLRKTELRERVAEIQAEISASCIAGRNEYSRGAIQRDFAAGIKELYQADQDEETFNPDEELHDYEKMGAELKVFCVSSRAYQKMCGRLKKDKAVPGFTKVAETEIPQLQAHAIELTEEGRIEASSKFLLAFIQQLNSFYLWATDDGTGAKMTNGEKRKQIKHLEVRLDQLCDGLGRAVVACTTEMKDQLRTQVLGRFPELIADATEVAPETSRKWGAHPDDGGLVWATYKAVCRRGGAYKSPKVGIRDFNADLLDPILRRQATAWERAFQLRLPKALNDYNQDVGKILHSFHEKIEERAQQMGISHASLSLLKNSMQNYKSFFRTLSGDLMAAMQEAQKDANRDFVPTLANIMEAAYDFCTNESGQGSFKRMKDYMNNFVDEKRHRMFKAATETVENHLTLMCRDLEAKMAQRSAEIVGAMRADYMRALGGVQPNQSMLSKEEQELRKEIKSLLLNVDSQFERIANGETEAEDDHDPDWVRVEQGEADISLHFDDEDADSARDFGSRSGDETMQDTVDGTFITESSPSKGSEVETEDEVYAD